MNTIKVWDTETWECLHTLEGREHTTSTASVASLVIDESQNRLYSALFDSIILIWDLETWTCLYITRGESYYFPCHLLLSSPFSDDQHRLYYGYKEDIQVLDTSSPTLNRVSKMTGHVNSIRCLCLSEDGRRLYSGSNDNTIRVWDLTSNTCIMKLLGHYSSVTSLCLSLKTDRLISASDNGDIKVWDTTTYRCIYTVSRASRNPIRGMALSDQNNTLYLPTDGNVIKVWHVNHSFY
jgi:WD40 repeat protein